MYIIINFDCDYGCYSVIAVADSESKARSYVDRANADALAAQQAQLLKWYPTPESYPSAWKGAEGWDKHYHELFKSSRLDFMRVPVL